MQALVKMNTDRRLEILGCLLLGIGGLLLLALATDGEQDQFRRSLSNMHAVPNLLGTAGAVTAGSLNISLGYAAHTLYVLFFIWGLTVLQHRPLDRLVWRAVGMAVLAVATAALLHVDMVLAGHSENPTPGGFMGDFFGPILAANFGVLGSNIILGTLGIIGILLSTEFLFLHFFRGVRAAALLVARGFAKGASLFYQRWRKYQEELEEKRREFEATARQLWERGPAEDHAMLPQPSEETEPDPIDVEASDAPQAGYGDYLERAARRCSGYSGYSDEDVESGDRLSAARGVFARINEPIDVEPDMVPPQETFTDRLRDAFEPMPEEPVMAEPVEKDASPEAVVMFDMFGPDEEPVPAPTPKSAAKPARKPEPEYVDEEEEYVPEPPRKAEPVRAKVASNKPVMPVRKMDIPDELPPDYKYPKRYTKPPIDMLASPPPVILSGNHEEQLRNMSMLLEEKLGIFGVEAKVKAVTRGPTITRFELEPSPGIKVSKFQALSDDLALALKAHSVRVEAPIPGKGRVGIEVPNTKRDPVMLRELLESSKFRRQGGQIPIAMGKGIAGEVMVTDLARMPHMLVAGATGAGKTVFVKTLLASLLFTHSPQELQLMMVDPKMVELSIFNDIPHLITPVVTEPKKAAAALNWLICEMEERYRLFAHLRVRNIEVYNESVDNGEIVMPDDADGNPRDNMNVIRKLPYIVCVIDELADLMIQVRAEVEDAIARIAQLARAVGIHLVIATQRPSVDVLTGVIKANFPARVSFQVSTRVDSRCILDEIGAENLVGMGDMLFLPAGQPKPTRIQGAFVSDNEMNTLIAYLKTQAPPQYRDEIQNFGKAKEDMELLEEEADELLDDAIRIVLETGQASISMVQRRLRVGYTRAARLIDMMELRGIVGPHTGSKAREILVDTPSRNEVA